MEKINVNLIGRKSYRFNDQITINIPLVKQIRGNSDEAESNFWREVHLFTTTPSDMISELDKSGIDFETINEYTLFMWLFISYQNEMKTANCHEDDKDVLFQGFNLCDLHIEEKNGAFILVDDNDNEIINETIYDKLSNVIADITGRKKTPKKKFGNSYAKKKRIEQDYKNKEKMRQQKEDIKSDALGGIILRLVCNTNFPYNFETVQDITIYDLLYSLKQIEKDIQVTDLMQTRLVGNDLSKLSRDTLNRFVL